MGRDWRVIIVNSTEFAFCKMRTKGGLCVDNGNVYMNYTLKMVRMLILCNIYFTMIKKQYSVFTILKM